MCLCRIPMINCACVHPSYWFKIWKIDGTSIGLVFQIGYFIIRTRVEVSELVQREKKWNPAWSVVTIISQRPETDFNRTHPEPMWVTTSCHWERMKLFRNKSSGSVVTAHTTHRPEEQPPTNKKKNGLSTCSIKTTMKGRCSTDTNRANHKTSSVSYVLHTPVQLCYQIRMCVCVCLCLFMDDCNTFTPNDLSRSFFFFFLQGRSSHPTICFDGNQGVRRTG